MSYLERLKAKNAEKAHHTILTKLTKDHSGSFVSSSGWHVGEKESPVVSHDATLLESFEERAAIIEYDGGIPRAEAERLAWGCMLGKEP